jgi:hypothetical protein
MPGKAPGAMNNEEEAGSDKVTACTRAFEEIDAQVFPGPGRGATLSEAAASDRWGGPSAATVEAYRRMFDIVVRHQRAYSREEPAGPQVTDHFGDQDRGGGDDSGQTAHEANLVDWGDVLGDVSSDLARQLSV